MEKTEGSYRRVKDLLLVKCGACGYEFVFANYKNAPIPKWTDCPSCKRQIDLKK
jgi:predicted Zn-ribbon and HTH transcriptional regulator